MFNFDATRAAMRVVEKYVYGLVTALPSIAIGLAVFFVFWLLGKLAGYLVTKAFEKVDKPRSLEILTSRLVRWAIYGFGFLVTMSIIFPSVNAQSILSALGIGSVAIGFAFKDIFQNWLAGILILITRPFKIGDEIVSEKDKGIVTDILVRATILKTSDNDYVVIPNSELFTNRVTVINKNNRGQGINLPPSA